MTVLNFDTLGGAIALDPRATVVAGWTGRDEAAVRHHIDELAAIGVPPPSALPLYYRVACGLLTQGDTIEAVGTTSSAEAEPVMIETDRGAVLTLGSDHTDRELEVHSVAASKQACAKPIAREAWPLADVADRLDTLVLRSWISEDGEGWTRYQDGTLAAMRPLVELREGAAAQIGGFAPGTVMFCGTLATVSGEIVPAPHFRAELHDPATGRTIAMRYATKTLPVIS